MVTVEEYTATSYRPDLDYLAGVLEARNAGTRDHSGVQAALPIWFWARRGTLRLRAFTEQRIQVAQNRFRVADVCLVRLPEPDEQIFTTPPYIVIEILSPDDTFPRLQQRLDDYLAMAVGNLWVIDPASRRAWTITVEGHREALDGVLRTADGAVSLPIGELFSPAI